MKFAAQQHLHDSHVSKQIQTVISPYILPLVLSLLFLTGYRSTFQGLRSLSSSDANNEAIISLAFKNETQLIMNTTSWDGIKNISTEIRQDQESQINDLLYGQVDLTSTHLEEWMNITIAAFENTLDAVIGVYETQQMYAEKIKKLVQGLNDTVVSNITEKNTQLSTLQSQISDSLSIGGSIDMSELSIDVSGISTDFAKVIDQLDVGEDKDLVKLNKSRDDTVSDVRSIFERAIQKVMEYEIGSFSTNITTGSSKPAMKKTFSNKTFANDIGPSTTSISTSVSSETSDTVKPALIVLGCCIVVGYVLISIMNHFHFQYSSHLRKDAFIHSQGSTDLQKSHLEFDDSLNFEDVSVVDNFNLIHHRLKEPTVTLLTDIISKVTGTWHSTYWWVEYLSMNIPLVVVMMVSIAVILIVIQKTPGNAAADAGDLTTQMKGNTTETVIMDIYTIEMPSLFIDMLDTSTDVDDWNFFVDEVQKNVTLSLSELFDDYDLGSILRMNVPVILLSSLNLTSLSAPDPVVLPDISLNSMTTLNVSTTSSVSMGMVAANITSQAISVMKNAVIKTCLITFAVLGGIGLLVLLLGVAYSLSM